MKKILVLAIAITMAAIFAACGARNSAASDEGMANRPTDDSEFTLLPKDNDPLPQGVAGKTIAFVTDAGGAEDGAANAAVWQGVQRFADSFGFTAQSYAAKEYTDDSARDALREGAESGAALVVCEGKNMAAALYDMQSNYPDVSYLLLDDEPHNADYSAYNTQSNVHCVLFREEQAGFLAGYAAVMEGYTRLGYLGSEALPGVVRYATGFMQGAESAAEQTGLPINLKTWYCGVSDGNEDITAHMSGWYTDGIGLVFVGGGTLAQGCAEAAAANGGKVIAANWNQQALGDTVLTTAEKNYSTITQKKLYSFFAAGGRWANELGGQTARVGIDEMAVGLPLTEWRFGIFTREQYDALYEKLRTTQISVERYSDNDTLPELSSVTVDAENG